jgi:hypothetical protein
MVVRRNAALLLALALLTIWALSSRIYLGPYLVASYEPPRVLTTTVLAWFRSCGRLFWPVGWLLVGFAIARAPVLFRPGSACVMMAMTLLLQWTDVSPWRARFAALFGTPVRSAFGTPADAARIANAIAKAGAVIVTPPVFCSTAGADYSSPLNMAAMEVQLMAARANARMASVYLSRTVPECTQPRGVGSPRVEVRLRDSNKSLEVRNDADPDNAECFDLPIAQVCSYR